jgi:hypothetical protein
VSSLSGLQNALKQKPRSRFTDEDSKTEFRIASFDIKVYVSNLRTRSARYDISIKLSYILSSIN